MDVNVPAIFFGSSKVQETCWTPGQNWAALGIIPNFQWCSQKALGSLADWVSHVRMLYICQSVLCSRRTIRVNSALLGLEFFEHLRAGLCILLFPKLVLWKHICAPYLGRIRVKDILESRSVPGDFLDIFPSFLGNSMKAPSWYKSFLLVSWSVIMVWW